MSIEQLDPVEAAVLMAARLTQDPKVSGLRKLEQASANFNYQRDKDLLNAFELRSLSTKEFKDVIKQIFLVSLTDDEAESLTNHFDRDGEGRVNTTEFLVQFMKLGTARRGLTRSVCIVQQRDAVRDREAKKIEKLDIALERAKTKADYNYSQDDFDYAMQKITSAAAAYDRQSPGAVQLDAFEGAAMEPFVFKEQLKRVFGIQLSTKQLGALMKYFDSNGDGTIDCAEFLVQFFRTGHTERSRIRKEWRNRDIKASEDKIIREQEQEVMNQRRGMALVDFDFSDEEMEIVVRKLMKLAGQFDVRQVGSAGLRAFMGKSLSATEFREQLKRTFSLPLNPQELGAIVSYFDTNGNGGIDCAEFKIHFFQLSLKVKAVLGKPDEGELFDKIVQECLADYDDRCAKVFQNQSVAGSDDQAGSLESHQIIDDDLSSEVSSEAFSEQSLDELVSKDNIGNIARMRRSLVCRKSSMMQFHKKQKKAVKLKRKALARVGGTCLTAESVLAARVRNSLKNGRVDLSTFASARSWAKNNENTDESCGASMGSGKCMVACPLQQAGTEKETEDEKKRFSFVLLRIPDGIMNNRFRHGVTVTEQWLDNNFISSVQLEELFSSEFMWQLRIVSLSNIGIDCVPPSMINLKRCVMIALIDRFRLQTLNLSKNQITNFIKNESVTESSFPLLTSLNLSHNEISILDRSIMFQLPKLNSLDLSYNKISEFEGQSTTSGHFPLSAFPSLSFITIDGNINISKDLALSITSIRSLRDFSVCKCPQASGGNLIDNCCEYFAQSDLCGGILERIRIGAYGGFISRLDVATKVTMKNLRHANDDELEEEAQGAVIEMKCSKLVDIAGNTDAELLNMLRRRALMNSQARK